MKKPKSILARIGMALTGAVVGSSAIAQESNGTGTQNASGQASRLEEVVVTAQRREQSIMEVPIAVTLVSGQSLETFNLETSHDLQFLVRSNLLRHIGFICVYRDAIGQPRARIARADASERDLARARGGCKGDSRNQKLQVMAGFQIKRFQRLPAYQGHGNGHLHD